MKKLLTIQLMFIFLVGALMLQGCGKKNKFENFIYDKENYEKKLADKTSFSTEDEISVYFDDQKLLYEKSTNTFYYSLNDEEGADNPRVFVVINEEEASVAVLENKISDEIIKNNDSITFSVYNDTAKKEFNLKLTTLPIINFDCTGLEDTEEEKTKMYMTLYDNQKGITERLTTSEGKIGIRGATTRQYPKKSFKIKLKTVNEKGKKKNNNISLLGMPEQSDWILYAAYNDGEKIRNVFSQNLWFETCATDNKLGIEAGLCYKYVEMFVNNEYYGLYALGYQMSDELMETGDNATLYKKAEWDAEDYISMFLNYFPGYKLWDDDNLQNEEIIDYSYWDRLLNMYYYLEDNKHDSSKLKSCIDENNAIDFYLFLNLVQGFDNVTDNDIKNMFVYIADAEEGNYQLYIPWDLDLTWGNEFIDNHDENNCAQYGVKPSDNAVLETGYLNQILVNGDTDIEIKIIEKYRDLRNNAWSDENITLLLNEYESDIYLSGAILREEEKWPKGSYNETGRGLSDFREYVLERLLEMDKYVERLENLESSNFFLRRAMKFDSIEEKTYLLQISDKSYLENADFLEFLNYLKIDADKITEEIQFVIGNRELGYEYLSFTDSHGDFRNTSFGILKNSRLSEREEKYYTNISFSVLLNGVALYDTYTGEATTRLFIFDDLYEGSFLYFDTDYNMTIDISSFSDFSLYIKGVKYTGGKTQIVIDNRSLLEDEKISKVIAQYAVGDNFEIIFSENGENTIRVYTTRNSDIVDDVVFSFNLSDEDGSITATQTKCKR